MDPETLRKYPKGTFFLPIDPETADSVGLDNPNARARIYTEGRKIIVECIDDGRSTVHET